MKRNAFPWLSLFSVFLALSLTFCTPPPSTSDKCESDADCDKTAGFRCLGRTCRKPAANAAPTAAIFVNPPAPDVGTQIILDGRRSFDPQADLLTYAWTLKSKPDGSAVDIEEKTSNLAKLTPDKAGTYVVTLVVTDEKGLPSPAVEASIQVQAGFNTPPIAEAGEDQILPPATKVALDGSKSSDPDGDKLIFSWVFRSKPTDSKAELDDAKAISPTFTPDKEGRYVLELVVEDARGEKSPPDTVTINVVPGADKTPVLTKITPAQAFAGSKIKMTLEGRDFVRGASVRIQGLTTTEAKMIRDDLLEVDIDLSLASAGTKEVYVTNPNNRSSTPALLLKIDAVPAPEIASATPSKVYVGSKATIVLRGKAFFAGVLVLVDNVIEAPTRIKSDTELAFDVDLTQEVPRVMEVTASNRSVNLTSKPFKLTIDPTPPKPVLNVLNPPFGTSGEKIAFSAHGISFEEGLEIVFLGPSGRLPVRSKRINRTEVRAEPSLDLAGFPPGIYEVLVRNPDGQESEKLGFRVQDKDPTPVMDRVLPFALYLGQLMSPVSVFGEQILSGAKLYIGTKEISGVYGKVTWKSATYLVADIDLRDETKWTPGEFDAVIENPNGKKSNAFKVLISYLTPSITSITPGSWSNQCDTDITIEGQNFVPKSKVQFGPSLVFQAGDPVNPLTVVNPTTIRLRLKATGSSTGTLDVVVNNGPNASSTATKFNIISGASLKPYPQYVRPSFGAADTKVSVYIPYDFNSPGGSTSLRPGAVVLLNGKIQKTVCSLSFDGTYCYDLTAELDLTGLAPGSYELFVANPCDVRSSAFAFSVEPPPSPYISSFVPAFARPGDQTKITIKGNFFTENHDLYWGTAKLPTVFKDSKEIETKDPINFTTSPIGPIEVRVVNANGKESAKTPFSIISTFTPTITEIDSNVQVRGRILPELAVKGTNFLLTSLIYVDGKPAGTKFISATELKLANYDTTAIAPGTYKVEVYNGSRASNVYPLVLTAPPPPIIDYLSKSSVDLGQTTTITGMYIYCSNFSRAPLADVLILDEQGTNLAQTAWVFVSSSTSNIRGDFKVGLLSPGKYAFQLRNPTGEVSNKVVFVINPPPPPQLTSVLPTFAYRGNPNQKIVLVGSSITKDDFIVFNNDVNNKLPVVFNTTTNNVEFTLDLSAFKSSGLYEIYILRCNNQACTQTSKSQVLKLDIRDPLCTGPLGVDCATVLPPAGSEACDAVDSVCRPKCTTSADCTTLAPGVSWTCKSGLCKK